MDINGISANVINLKDGWMAVVYGNALFILDRRKGNISLQRPRTVFSLITADPSLCATEIHNIMAHVTNYYKLRPWTANKDPRASIYFALESAKRDTGKDYKRIIKEWYKNAKDKAFNKDEFYKNITTIESVANPLSKDNICEQRKRRNILEKGEDFLWSITKDQKIMKRGIYEYRIESVNAIFNVIADGYEFKSGVIIYSAKTKDECIEYIDKITEVDNK